MRLTRVTKLNKPQSQEIKLNKSEVKGHNCIKAMLAFMIYYLTIKTIYTQCQEIMD